MSLGPLIIACLAILGLILVGFLAPAIRAEFRRIRYREGPRPRGTVPSDQLHVIVDQAPGEYGPMSAS